MIKTSLSRQLAPYLIIKRPLDTCVWFHFFFYFGTPFLSVLSWSCLPVRLDVLKACYSSQPAIHRLIPFQWCYFGTASLTSCLIHIYLSTFYLSPKKQAVQTERISDMRLHILVASEGEIPCVQSNIIFLPSISLKNLARFLMFCVTKSTYTAYKGKIHCKGKNKRLHWKWHVRLCWN